MSCYNPNIGTGKKTLPAPTYQQPQYEQEPHDKPSQRQAAVRSQDQPRATGKPLPTTSSAPSPSQQVAKKQPTSPQQTPSSRTLSVRNQHKLLLSQRAAQAKREEREAALEEAHQPTQPSQLRPAITPPPPRPTPSPSFADKAPPGTLSPTYLAQGGHQVNFIHQDGQWWACVNEHLPIGFTRRIDLPVYCEPGSCVAAVGGYDTTWHKHRIHVCFPEKTPDHRGYVYIGSMGLKGGGSSSSRCAYPYDIDAGYNSDGESDGTVRSCGYSFYRRSDGTWDAYGRLYVRSDTHGLRLSANDIRNSSWSRHDCNAGWSDCLTLSSSRATIESNQERRRERRREEQRRREREAARRLEEQRQREREAARRLEEQRQREREAAAKRQAEEAARQQLAQSVSQAVVQSVDPDSHTMATLWAATGAQQRQTGLQAALKNTQQQKYHAQETILEGLPEDLQNLDLPDDLPTAQGDEAAQKDDRGAASLPTLAHEADTLQQQEPLSKAIPPQSHSQDAAQSDLKRVRANIDTPATAQQPIAVPPLARATPAAHRAPTLSIEEALLFVSWLFSYPMAVVVLHALPALLNKLTSSPFPPPAPTPPPPPSAQLSIPEQAAPKARQRYALQQQCIAHFTRAIAPILHQKLWQTSNTALQEEVLQYWQTGGVPYPLILQAHAAEDWVYASLLQDLVGQEETQPNQLAPRFFRERIEALSQQHPRSQILSLLYTLRAHQHQHALQVTALNNLLDLLPPSLPAALSLLQEAAEPPLITLRKHWWQQQIQQQATHWSQEAQEQLTLALAQLNWPHASLSQLAAQLPNMPAQDLLPFLQLLGAHPNSDYQIAQMLQQSPQAHEAPNPLPHWTHYLQSCRLDAPLLALFPAHFQDLCPLLHTLLQQGCQYKTLLGVLNQLQEAHSPHDPAHQTHLAQQFRQVLHLLIEYHTPDPLCQQAFATCQQHTPAQWPSIIHKQLVAHTFLPAHERTLDELIDYIATHAPHTTFASNPAQLKQSYQEVYTAYHAPSAWLLAHVQKQPAEQPQALKKLTVPITQWPAETVTQWAQLVRARAANPALGTMPTQAECIAVVMRAVELHHRFSPRATQLLSLLTLLNTASNAGRLAQINTGEGKSLIVAMLAALHALQGTKVDVITTSPELSIPEINKQQPFFSMLTLTVGENSSLGQWKEDEARKQLYQQDIVYGTAGDFQADILRTEFCGNNLRGKRGFGVVIVDEVDSMLFDDRTHSTRLATPLPAMNHLELPLAHIYNYVNMVARRLITIHEKEGDQTLPKHYYIADDFQRKGKQLTLKHHPDKPWQELAVPVEDKAKFLQDNATEHLQTLLRPLHGQEREAYQAYQKLNEEIIALSHEIAAEEEKQQAQQRAFAEQEREKWSNKCESTRNQLEEALQEQLAQQQKEAEAQLHNLTAWQEREKLHEELSNCHWEKACTPVLDVPAHLRHFAHEQVPQWVQSAMSALFLQQKDRNYAVRNGKIIPIDYNNTGVLQQNMVWSDGLAQFLQIKEGLKVSPEGISTNYLSTVSFFKRYGAAVYGLTGTMGNETTQNFFQEIYGTDAIIIPPYKHRPIIGNEHSHYHCKELTAQILPTQEQWQQAICQSVIAKAQQKQAVLVICKYIQQVTTLQAQITQQYPSSKVYTYTGTDTFDKEEVDAGDIILATNIAGRGTDLTTAAEVEAHGGLHVCITFLPESYRVELQNAGRTARKGQQGTAQLIIHDPAQPTIEALRTIRQEREDEAITQAQKGIDQILLRDQLFGRYCAVDNAFFPNQEETQKQAQYQLLTHEWALCRQQALTPTRLQALYRQAIDTATTTQLATKLSTATPPAETPKVEKIIRATVLPQKITHQDYQQFVQHCQAQLLEHFCATYQDAVAPDVLEAFRHQKPWGNPEALAQRYSWGEHERGALQERWGQGLKIIGHQHQEPTKEVLNKWFDGFEADIRHDAHYDQIVKNPWFYVNKANDLLEQGHYSEAIQYFDRAIALDPQFSVTARYNKVRAMLSQASNKHHHAAALTELRTLQVLIEAYYRKPLTAFNALTSQTGTKQQLSAHVQHQLDISSQLESYSHQAIAAIQDAQDQGKDGWDVKLTNHATTEPFQNAPENRRQALEEAKVNGLTHFFTVEKVQPKPSFWKYFALAIVGIAQAGLGVLLTCAGALNMAKTFILEGVKDLIAAIKKGFQGEGFTWGEWALQKVISVTTAIVTWGLNKLNEGIQAAKEGVKTGIQAVKEGVKTGIQAMKDGVKQGIEHAKELGTKLAAGGMDGIKKASIKTAMGRIGLTLGKEIAKECATDLLNYTADKTLVNDIAHWIQKEVTQTIEEELKGNPLVERAIALDVAQNTNHWQNTFLQLGQELLRQDNSKLKQFIQGVLSNSHKNARLCLDTLKAQKTIADLFLMTTDFMKKFNKKVKQHQRSIEQAEQACQKQQEAEKQLQALAEQADELQQRIQQVADTKTDDLTEDDIPTQVLGEQGTYQSELAAPIDNLSTHYTAPSTTTHLRDTFSAHLTAQLTNKVRQHLVQPLTSRAASYGIERLAAPAERALQTAEAELLAKQATRHVNTTFIQEAPTPQAASQQQYQDTEQALQAIAEAYEDEKKQEEAKTAYLHQLCDAHDASPEVRQEVLALLVEHKEGDIGLTGALAHVLQCPAILYGPDGKYHTTLGEQLPGKPITLHYNEELQHWHGPPGQKQIAVSGSNNCLFDAAISQVENPEQLGLHTGAALRIATAHTLLHNDHLAQQLVQHTKALAYHHPALLWKGGNQQVEYYYMQTDPHCFLNRAILASDQAYRALERQEQTAIQAGDQAQANTLSAQLRAREVKAFHAQQAKEQAWCSTLGQMTATGGVAYFTCGAGVPAYLLSRLAMSVTSMALDPSLRSCVARGDWPGALAVSQTHFPFWGPIHSGFKAVGQGAYVQAGLQAGVLGLDVAGLRYAGRKPGRLPAPSEPARVPFEVKGEARFTEIGSGLSKADARVLIRSGNLGLTDGQTASILKKLGKGRSDSVGIRIINENGNVRLTLERAGAQSGFQRFSFEIDPSGKTLRTVQTAFDNAGNLVPQAPGAIKNNLFDIK